MFPVGSFMHCSEVQDRLSHWLSLLLLFSPPSVFDSPVVLFFSWAHQEAAEVSASVYSHSEKGVKNLTYSLRNWNAEKYAT